MSNNYEPVKFSSAKQANEWMQIFSDDYWIAKKKISLNKAFGLDGIKDIWLRQYAYPQYSGDGKTIVGYSFSPLALQWLNQITGSKIDASTILKDQLLIKQFNDQIYLVIKSVDELNNKIFHFVKGIFKLEVRIPKYLLDGRLVLLSKDKSQAPSPRDTRPIVILSVIRKLVELVWLQRYAKTLWKCIGRYQMGFRPKASTHLQVVR